MRYHAYDLLRDFAEELKGSSYEATMIKEHYQINKFRRSKTGNSTIRIDLPFAQMSTDWVKNMSKSAQLFIFNKILPEIKMYNLLWYYPTPKKSVEKNVIKELIDKKILFRTETVEIYIINPIKLWRGTIFSAIEATKHVLKNKRIPELDMIHDLKPSEEYRSDEDQMDLLNGNSITPKLLE